MFDCGLAYVRYPWLRDWGEPYWLGNRWCWSMWGHDVSLYEDGHMDESWMGLNSDATSHEFLRADLP